MVTVHVSGAAAAGGEVVCLGGADGGVGFEDVEVEGGHVGWVWWLGAKRWRVDGPGSGCRGRLGMKDVG